MRFKRYLFFTLILFLIIFSVSFVSANEDLTHGNNTNDITALSTISDDSIIDENINDVKLSSVKESSSSTLDLADEAQQSETEKDDCLTNEPQILRASNDEPVLGSDQYLNWGTATAQQVMNAIVQCSNSGGGTVYLYGRDYTGTAELIAGANSFINIKNVRVVGGSPENPNQIARFNLNEDNIALTFKGYSTGIPGQYTPWGSQRQGYYSTSGVNLENVVFENIYCTERMFNFGSGSLTNVVFNNIESEEHLFFLTGAYWDSTPISLTNCNFTNCHQTFQGKNPEAGTDGDGQLGAVFGAKFVGCNFINTSSATHGGAFCLSDESEWGAARVASSIIDCNFINITSRWFAIYIHGNFSTSFAYIDQPQVIDNCNFINCTGTGEYGGAVGISHNGVEVKNSNFINNTGGQGAAIMVGGIDRNHDGFDGRNTRGNNILIENCKFEGNVAKVDGQSSSVSPDHGNFEGHPTGNAGAIYIYGNDIRILDSTFDSNIAGSGEGAAVYIHGERTVIDNSKFYNHESDRGTVYIEGGNSKIIDSTFKDNSAENGAGVYIEGKNTLISGTDFDSNVATENGAGVYIKGDNTRIISDSSFENNLAVDGAGVYVVGKGTEISSSAFEYNNATNGGAVYINGQTSTITSNTFDHNNVTNHGGAVYVEGSGTQISLNTFTNNEAVPESAEGTDGLGGAIYVKGDNTNTDSNEFTHNKARNGSAIYTDGNNFNLAHDIFNENQAWSYLLIVTPKPEESYYNESDVNITICHVGGDNIINAIHNTAGPSQVHFTDVTSNNNGRNIYTGTSTVSPVAGAENSNNGQLVYQDDREYIQKIKIIDIVCDETGKSILQDYVDYTNITGEIRVTLRKPIEKGNYTVYAEHPEDWNYKYISNTTKFKVVGLVDLSTEKTSDQEEYYIGDTVTWTITVRNANNASRADNIVLKDVLPSEVAFVNATVTNGTYDNATNTWKIDNLTAGDSAILTIITTAIKEGQKVTNSASVTCDDEDWNLTNNKDNATVKIKPVADLSIVKEADPKEAHKGDTVTWRITVTNNGPSKAENVRVSDAVPVELTYDEVVSVSKGSFDGSVWTIGDLDVDGEATLVIKTTVVESDVNITNVATVTSDTYDPVESNNVDNDTVVIPPEADLSIVKVVTPGVYHIGDAVVWTITVTNNGPDKAVNVTVSDAVPVELTYDEVVSVSKGSFDGSVWTFDELDVGESVSLVITTTVAKSNVNVTNVVVVDSDTYDPNESNNVDNDTVVIPPEADLSIVKVVTPGVYHIGDAVVWTITVTNNGPDVAVDAYVDDVIPKELTDVSVVSVDKGSFDGETWTIGNLTSGESVVLVIKTTVDATNVNVTNVVLVNSSTYDPNKTNNKNNDSVEVPPEADLAVIITNNFEGSGEICHDGDEIVWTITVTNNGPDTAVNSVLRDVLPEGVVYVSHDNANGTYDNEGAVWSIGDLPNGETVTLTIVTKANTTNATVYRNVSVSSDTYDPNLSNNYDNSSVEIPPEADLEVIITNDFEESNSTAHNGDTVTWTITVTNNGPDTAIDTILKDVLPDGVIYVSDDSNGTYDNESAVWSIGDLPVGETVTLKITTIANTTNDTVYRNVSVSSKTYDPNLSNNYDNSSVVVLPEADLTVNKSVDVSEARFGDVVTWTITLVNNGPDAAVNVSVTDVIPKELVYSDSDVTIDDGSFKDNVWFVDEIASGKTLTLVIKTTVNATNTTIVNVVNVTSDTYDPNETNNNGTNNTVIPPEADLEVIITNNFEDSDVPCHIGDTITWTITVTNHGPDDAINTVLSDSLPDGVIYVSDDSNGAYDPETGIWTIGDLPVGESVTLVIKTIANTTNDTVVREVNVSSDTYDPNLINNYDNSSVVIPPEADLSINKTVSDASAHKGDKVTWTITLVNNGPDAAVNVVVNDAIPKELVNVNVVSVSQGKFADGVWAVGNLTGGASAILVIETTVDATNATIENVVNTTSETYDPNETNNNGTNNTVIPPEADLEVVIINNFEGSDVPCHVGDTVEWTITVTNHGPDDAINTVLSDSLPDGVIYVSDDSNGAYDPETGVWTIGDLPVGESVTLTIKTIANTSNDTIIRDVNVSSETYDPDLTNNYDNSSVEIPPEADLEVTITNDHEDVPCHNGENVTWTITIVNHGPDDAINTKLSEILPEGVVYVSDDSNGKYDSETGTWTVGDLVNGDSITLTIVTTIKTSNVTIVNPVNVSSDTYDPNLTNNKDNSSVVVIPEADLEIIKLVSNNVSHKNDEITWTIIVTNNGRDTAVNAAVTDKLPSGLVYVSDDSNGDYDAETGVWTIGDISSGKSVTLNIVTLVGVTNQTMINVANVTSDTYDPNETNNKCNNTTDVPPEADLVITVEPNVDKVKVGDEVEFTVTVVNQGPDTAVNSHAFITLPDGLKLLDFKPSKGTYNPKTGVWTIGDLAPGEEVTLILNTEALVSGKFVIQAYTVCDTYESNLTNNNDATEIGVIEPEIPETSETPETSKTPEEPPVDNISVKQTMYATGNPIIMVLMALFAMVCITLRRKS